MVLYIFPSDNIGEGRILLFMQSFLVKKFLKATPNYFKLKTIGNIKWPSMCGLANAKRTAFSHIKPLGAWLIRVTSHEGGQEHK
jgi:hypothetical protein